MKMRLSQKRDIVDTSFHARAVLGPYRPQIRVFLLYGRVGQVSKVRLRLKQCLSWSIRPKSWLYKGLPLIIRGGYLIDWSTLLKRLL